MQGLFCNIRVLRLQPIFFPHNVYQGESFEPMATI